MANLIILPNGNAVRPDKITQVIYFPKNIYQPDRVFVSVLNGSGQMIDCESPEEAKRMRDEIIASINSTPKHRELNKGDES